MSFTIKPILDSKEAMRKKLRDLPLDEKLAMLDLLRERAIMLRHSAERLQPAGVHEKRKSYVPEKK